MDSATLTRIANAFSKDEFSYDPQRYAEHIRSLLRLGPPKDLAEPFFELLERMLDMLWDSNTPQLTTEDRETILELLKRYWSPQLPPHRRATMVTIAGYLLPHADTREWLLSEATKTQGALSTYLRQTANTERKHFVV
jgi:hypothetical protein